MDVEVPDTGSVQPPLHFFLMCDQRWSGSCVLDQHCLPQQTE